MDEEIRHQIKLGTVPAITKNMKRIYFMQSQNFENLRPHWPDLANLGGHAEQIVTFPVHQQGLNPVIKSAAVIAGYGEH